MASKPIEFGDNPDLLRAQVAATREILHVVNRSRADAQPVFDLIVKQAKVLCDALFAGLVLGQEGDEFQRVVASEALPEPVLQLWHDNKYTMERDRSLVANAILDMKVNAVHDMGATAFHRNGDERYKVVVTDAGVRSNLLVPLIKDGRGIGCLMLGRTEVRPYSGDEIALVETFAAQAVIAIENVRQFHDVQVRLEREEAAREILQAITASRTDPTPVFDVILKSAAQLSGAPLANLCLINEARSHWHLAAHFGDGLRHLSVGKTTPMDVELVPAVAMRTARVVHIENLIETELYRQGDPGRHAMVHEEGMRTILGVPLLREGQAIGCITLFRREVKAFTEDEITLVETFAAQAVIAIENVRQFKALEALNAELGERVEEQVGEIERMGRLKRFLPPAVADTVVSSGSEAMLESHRALLGILFCDIRGFTAFCESAEPEETIEVLQTYHEEMGKLIVNHGAGVDHRMGDGIMVLFNDPVPCDDPAGDAVRLAIAMRDRMAGLCQGWKRLGHRLGFGVGIAMGYATVGMVGYEGRFDYTASGTAVNLAARLCDQAEDGEILLSPRAQVATEDDFETEMQAEIELKGIAAPVQVFRLLAERSVRPL